MAGYLTKLLDAVFHSEQIASGQIGFYRHSCDADGTSLVRVVGADGTNQLFAYVKRTESIGGTMVEHLCKACGTLPKGKKAKKVTEQIEKPEKDNEKENEEEQVRKALKEIGIDDVPGQIELEDAELDVENEDLQQWTDEDERMWEEQERESGRARSKHPLAQLVNHGTGALLVDYLNWTDTLDSQTVRRETVKLEAGLNYRVKMTDPSGNVQMLDFTRSQSSGLMHKKVVSHVYPCGVEIRRVCEEEEREDGGGLKEVYVEVIRIASLDWIGRFELIHIVEPNDFQKVVAMLNDTYDELDAEKTTTAVGRFRQIAQWTMASARIRTEQIEELVEQFKQTTLK
ncbi:unnamed protein product [Caenorhabditis sp. 36 PRJEB53466]|nr:unnamed protein product [Caenorhabditis sp. 36 PRJEB53466]